MQFAKRNKVATLESYEQQKQKESSSQMFTRNERKKEGDGDKGGGGSSATPKTSTINMEELNQVVDLDPEVHLAAAAYADAEQGLENLALFNEEMSTISMNAFQIYSLFELINKENEEIIEWMQQIERQTINVEERHLKIERKLE